MNVVARQKLGTLLKCVTLAAAFVSAATWRDVVHAGTVKLWGIADGDSTYIEQPSDGFYRMDLYDPPPNETKQRFHSITDPSVTFGSPSYDGFPHDENFRLGTLTYDDSMLPGGSGIAPITAMALGVGQDPEDDSYYNYYRWLPLNTIIDSFWGAAILDGGTVIGVVLESRVRLEFNPFGTFVFQAPGAFKVAGSRFEGHMETPYDGPNSQAIWDFGGTLTTVIFEPSGVPGDYNGNGTVGPEDYDVWRLSSATTNAMADGNLDGIVDAADYVVWRGNAAPAVGTSMVPEGGAAVLIAIAMTLLSGRRGSRLGEHRFLIR